MSDLHKRILYLFFALSGFSALVYEILWTKYLSLIFGTTMVAVSIVAATFMGGLAIGSYLIGRRADQETNLLRVYALLELGIAVSALLFPVLIELIEAIYVALNHAYGDSGGLIHALHLALSVLILLPPTLCMGGTFPLMCRFFARKKSGGQIARLYALNTLGATLGAFLSGYLLIPELGLTGTGLLAAAFNLAIAVGTWLLADKITVPDLRDTSLATRPEQPIQARAQRPILLAIGAVGFISMGYEILWTRTMLLFLGNTTYAFALLLSAFLISLALGGALYARMVQPQLDERRVFLKLSLLMGISVLLTAPFYDEIARVFQFAHQASGERWWHLSMLSGLIVFAVVSVPTVISGALLPAAVAIVNPGRTHTGEGVGLVVLHNTTGAVLGSLFAGFVMLPHIGLLHSFQMLAAGNIAMAVGLYFHYRSRTRFSSAVPVLAGAALLLIAIPVRWDMKLINSGVYCYAPKFTQVGGIDRALAGEKILEVFEGSETTVAVKENADRSVRYFAVNGKTDGGNGQDMATQVLVGALPMLFHPAPAEVLVVGYGSGITVGAVKAFHTNRILCVEISPEVIKAASYFDRDNDRPLDDPRVTLLVEDGRNLLMTRPDKYDVIVSEPSNPWQAGNANLFTDEYYRLAAGRLKTNGIFCQWIGLYDITPDNLRIATRTLLKNFTHILSFKVGADLILVAANRDLPFDYDKVATLLRSPRVSKLMTGIGINGTADLIARHYFSTENTLVRFAGTASAINTDNRNILEYSAHNNLGDKMFGKMQMANTMALTRVMSDETFPLLNLGTNDDEVRNALLDLGKAYYREGDRGKAAFFMRKAASYAVSQDGDGGEIVGREG